MATRRRHQLIATNEESIGVRVHVIANFSEVEDGELDPTVRVSDYSCCSAHPTTDLKQTTTVVAGTVLRR